MDSESFSFVSKIFNRISDDELPLVCAAPSWVAHYPNPRVLARSGAWYFSVAAHTVPDDHSPPKRSKNLFSSAHCLVLDDVGSKVSPSIIPAAAKPSWVMETSPKNYQWGYLIHRFDQRGAYEGAMRALAARGLTDSGAVDCVHLFRLPGSLHKSGFKAKLRQFTPNRRYLLKNLMNRFGISSDVLNVPDQKRWSAPTPATEEEIANDTVWGFIVEHELYLGDLNDSGWAPIVCPWFADHTDPNDTEARYLPGDRGAFHCFHESCSNRSTTDYIDWVNEQERLLCLKRRAEAAAKPRAKAGRGGRKAR